MNNFNLLISPDLLKQTADAESFSYVKNKLKHKKRQIGKILILDDTTYQYQKLIYSYADVLFNILKVKEDLRCGDNFSLFKQRFSLRYKLGEFSKQIQFSKNNEGIIEIKGEVWKRWSWSYFNLKKKKARKILNALSDLGSRLVDYPFEIFYLGSMNNMKDYLKEVQLNRCAITNEFLIYFETDLHHTYLHNTQVNRRNYPNLIDSIVNLYAVDHSQHMRYGTWRPLNLTELELKKLEIFLSKNEVERSFVNNPVEANNFSLIYKKFQEGKLNPLFKKSIKGKVFYL